MKPAAARLEPERPPFTAANRRAKTKTSVLVAHELARQAAALEPGDVLPPERVLIEQMQVGRGTLREALRLLELQGVVTIKAGPGGGPVVARPDHHALSNSLALALQGTDATFKDLVDARRSLEAELARLAATNRSAEDVEALEDSLRAMKGAVGTEEGFLAENLRFHERCASAAGSRILELFHASLKELSDGHAIGASFSPRHRQAVLAAHTRIVAAIASGDPDASYAAMSDHMGEFEEYLRRRYPEMLNRPIRWILAGS
jgi:GntR family transcriptional repressor for pyruvate dehydrogenase complex